MQFITEKEQLRIKLDRGEKTLLRTFKKENEEIISTQAEADFFEPFLANSEFQWIRPEEICALTSAPILGIKNENEEVTEAYGFMNYAVRGMLEDLLEYGEVIMQKG